MKELQKKEIKYCVKMRNGIEIWIDEIRVNPLRLKLNDLKNHLFVQIDDQTFNTADISGIFDMDTIEKVRMLKQGMWECPKCEMWNTKKYEWCAKCFPTYDPF